MNNDELIRINSNQTISEIDQYTLERYKSFTFYMKPSTETIIDFGCNTGRGGKILKEILPNVKVIGADIIVDRLSKISKEYYTEIVDLNKRTLKEFKSIDVIVSGEVVEHIPIVSLTSYLEQFYQILKLEGQLILTTPNPDAYLVRLGRNAVFKDESHVNIMQPKFLVTLLEKIGFNNIIIKGSGKATRYLGANFPLINLYGSYMIIASK